jgi:hypothetical protein
MLYLANAYRSSFVCAKRVKLPLAGRRACVVLLFLRRLMDLFSAGSLGSPLRESNSADPPCYSYSACRRFGGGARASYDCMPLAKLTPA